MSAIRDPGDHRYRWIALTNTTLGIFMATINGSIILISLPAVFRGVGINPLAPSNVGYLLWLLQGYLLVRRVLLEDEAAAAQGRGDGTDDAHDECGQEDDDQTAVEGAHDQAGEESLAGQDHPLRMRDVGRRR